MISRYDQDSLPLFVALFAIPQKTQRVFTKDTKETSRIFLASTVFRAERNIGYLPLPGLPARSISIVCSIAYNIRSYLFKNSLRGSLCVLCGAVCYPTKDTKSFHKTEPIKLRKRNALRIAFLTEKAFQQKPGYVHQSAVIAGLVHFEEDDKYSSAAFYRTGNDAFNLSTHYSGN